MSGEHGHEDIAALIEQRATEAAADANALGARVDALEGAAMATIAEPGTVDVDSFDGDSFYDRLAAALAYAAAQTYKPTVRLPHGASEWTRTVTAFTGMKISGAGGGVAVEQPRSGHPYATLINYKGTDPAKPMIMFPAGQTFGVFVGHFAVSGTASSTIVGSATSSAVAWRTTMRDLGMANMKHALGTPSQQLLMTACTLDGDWNINNARGDAVTVGGSDNQLWSSGTCLIDSPTNLNTGVGAMFHARYLSKSVVGGLYVTCEGTPTGVRVTGGGSTRGLVLLAPRIEGRNAARPSLGSVMRVEGGDLTVVAPWFGYGFTSPATSGKTGEGGLVSVLGGDVTIVAPSWEHATAVAAETPVIYQAAGSLHVSAAKRAPLVRSTGGTFTHDGTCRTA